MELLLVGEWQPLVVEVEGRVVGAGGRAVLELA